MCPSPRATIPPAPHRSGGARAPASSAGDLADLPVAIVRYDRALHRIYANPHFERVTGLRPEEYLGCTPSEWSTLGDDAVRMEALLRTVLDDGVPGEMDIESTGADGVVRWFTLKAIPEFDPAGEVVSALTVSVETTRQKAAERIAREREHAFRSLADSIPVDVFHFDRDGRIRFANSVAAATLRRPAEQLLGRRLDELGLPLLAQVHEQVVAVAGDGMAKKIELRQQRDGHPFPEIRQIRLLPETDPGGATAGVIGIGRDITAAHLQDEAWRFVTRQSLDHNADSYFFDLVRFLGELLAVDHVLVDRFSEDDPGFAQTVAFYSKGALRPALRYALRDTPCEAVAQVKLCCHPRDAHVLFPRDRFLVEQGVQSYVGVPLVDATGRAVGLLAVMDGNPILDEEAVVGVLRKIAGHAGAELIRRHADRRLRESERLFRTLAELSPDYVARYDAHGRKIYVSPNLAAFLEQDELQAIGRSPAETSPGDAGIAEYDGALARVLTTGMPEEIEFTFHRNQSINHVRLIATRDSAGAIDGAIAYGRDITQIVAQRERIKTLALTDTVTKLANRHALQEVGATLLARARERRSDLGVLFLDVDGLKDINDTLGHSAGDHLLRDIAERIRQCVGPADLLARVGGDEFAIVAPAADGRTNMEEIVGRIRAKLAEPFRIEHRMITASVSMGLAMYPEHGDDLEQLMAHADAAMYQAKRKGRGNWETFRHELGSRGRERLDLLDALREAETGAGLELHFQPVVELRDGTWIGAEALLRLRRPDDGLLTPDRFMDIAEESGSIIPIGRWVMRRGAEMACRWNQGRRTPLTVNVNVSTNQFLYDDIASLTREILQQTGARPEWLAIEVTESLLLEDSARIHDAIRALHAIGVNVFIDDFGTGYSSLGYLNRFQVTGLKIDRQFVDDIDGDSRQYELVNACISLARALRLRVVAEGIERETQVHILNQLGCPVGQGYLFGRPQPVDRFAAAIAARDVRGAG